MVKIQIVSISFKVVTVYQKIMKPQEGARYHTVLFCVYYLASGLQKGSVLILHLGFPQGLWILINGFIHGKYVLIIADVSFHLVYKPSLKQLLLLW